jgi:hypothetical protein
MPDWFTPLVIILALAALALFVAFWTTRRHKYVAGVGVALALIVVAYLIARFVPTDRKAIESAIEDMAAGVKNRNPNQIFAHLAKDFRYRSLDKDAFQRRAESHVRGGTVDEVRILSYEKFDIRRAEKKADVEFQIKPFGSATGDTLYYLCRARFVLEEDGKWRMQTFDLYNPFVESNRAIDIPGVN